MDLGVKGMKGLSTLLKAPEPEPHHQMQFSDIIKTSIFGDGEEESFISRGYPQRILCLIDRTNGFS